MIYLRSVFLFWIFTLIWVNELNAQGGSLSTENKKAIKLFYSAIERYQVKNTEEALSDLKKAITADPLFTEAFILQGDIYNDDRQFEKAIESYQTAINTNKPFSPALFSIIATIQLNLGRYTDAQFNFQRFLESGYIPENKKQQAEQGLKVCAFAINNIAHPVPFLPVNLGDSINSPYDDYVNILTADEELLYFTRKNPSSAKSEDKRQDYEEDFYVSHRIDSTWSEAIPLGPPVNTNGNEGALTISPDGNFLFFAACDRPDGYGSCDIYWAKRIGDHWTVPQNMGPRINSPQWDSQPSFSSDGKTLYFASKRPGGKGSSDIWNSQLQPDGQWSEPVNLGDSINTKAEEMAPFIHPDDQTLYFSSKGHLGMGGLDLFFSRKIGIGTWGQPVNMGFPINTQANEISIIVNAKGNMAYISSDLPGGKGGQDIYKFPLYKEAQPVATSYLKGIVFDQETKKRMAARFELIDLETSQTVVESVSDPLSGEFLLLLPSEKNYALNVSREGYLFFSENFSLRGTNSSIHPLLRNIPLKPIKIGESVVLKNIFFDTDKFVLKDESTGELRKLIDYLQKNPKLKIEISGHTDNQGTEEYNVVLSQNRAKSVYDFLIQNGIEESRLSYKGYGFTHPVDTNSTDQGRANNRRTEFKILEN
ncbi:MAG: OmpA family protein [Bacteroidales bacterium]|jgi:outer membrane protein OmpA-like peptidoglycan-associated protein|nr:OmpA family protein [Bacteroidales bacterium]